MIAPQPGTVPSPFLCADPIPLSLDKFRDPALTASGEARAEVTLRALETLWFNTGTRCNLTCRNCYIESSPVNDALEYLTLEDLRGFLDEIAEQRLGTSEIGFTGGEPFMNREIMAMLQLCLGRGYRVLVLSNAMRPMRRFDAQLLALPERDSLTIRVSLDHYTRSVHEAERGAGTWAIAIDGLQWLVANGFAITVAGRSLPGESGSDVRAGYAACFAEQSVPLDAFDPSALVLFPEMDAAADVPEISERCWQILGVDPGAMMCASSRMVVRRRGEERPRVAACTLLPHEPGFDLGGSLAEARRTVALNHPHCARFCVLGGASCSGG